MFTHPNVCYPKKIDHYLVIAYYAFFTIEDPKQWAQAHHTWLSTMDTKGRIYVSTRGVNAQFSIRTEDWETCLAGLRAYPGMEEVMIKVHSWPTHPFDKLRVKSRPLVGLDEEVAYGNGTYLSPKQWRDTIESDEDIIVLDVRNQYEWELGHFQGARPPGCESFRDFLTMTHKIKEEEGTEKKVLMYCTGGIRCDIYANHMKAHGFQNVYQLEGGIINYGLQEGNAAWDGSLFVFDDRLNVPLSDETPHRVIAKCHHCGTEAEDFYNCANVDCNRLFIACDACHAKQRGCCCSMCQTAPRCREPQPKHRPFRPLHREQLDTHESTAKA